MHFLDITSFKFLKRSLISFISILGSGSQQGCAADFLKDVDFVAEVFNRGGVIWKTKGVSFLRGAAKSINRIQRGGIITLSKSSTIFKSRKAYFLDRKTGWSDCNNVIREKSKSAILFLFGHQSCQMADRQVSCAHSKQRSSKEAQYFLQH